MEAQDRGAKNFFWASIFIRYSGRAEWVVWTLDDNCTRNRIVLAVFENQTPRSDAPDQMDHEKCSQLTPNDETRFFVNSSSQRQYAVETLLITKISRPFCLKRTESLGTLVWPNYKGSF
jgi:hypothetical protein